MQLEHPIKCFSLYKFYSLRGLHHTGALAVLAGQLSASSLLKLSKLAYVEVGLFVDCNGP